MTVNSPPPNQDEITAPSGSTYSIFWNYGSGSVNTGVELPCTPSVLNVAYLCSSC